MPHSHNMHCWKKSKKFLMCRCKMVNTHSLRKQSQHQMSSPFISQLHGEEGSNVSTWKTFIHMACIIIYSKWRWNISANTVTRPWTWLPKPKDCGLIASRKMRLLSSAKCLQLFSGQLSQLLNRYHQLFP